MPDLSDFAKKSDIPNVGGFITAAALAPLALKADIPTPDFSDFVRKSDLPAAPDLSGFARLADVPTVPPPVDLTGYVRKSDLPAPPDLSRFAVKADIPQIPAAPDLSGFLRRSDLPDLSGVVRVRELESQLQERDAIIATLTSSLNAEQSKREAEIARLEGLLREALSRPVAAAAPAAAAAVVRDDLKKVYGIGPVLAKRLNTMGITAFAQIARWSDADIDTIEPKLDTIAGRIRREGWVSDSARLHQEKYGERIQVIAKRKE